MGIGNKLNTEVTSWIALAILIVIGSIVLLKFKTSNVGNMTCAVGTIFNDTTNKCCVGTVATKLNCSGTNSSTILTTAQTTDTFVSALSEPKNWVAIVLIALIGFGILVYVRKKRQ